MQALLRAFLCESDVAFTQSPFRFCLEIFLKVVIPLPSDLPKFTLRTDKQTLDKFRVVAQKNLRTVNRELEMLMRQHIADYEDKHGEIVLPQNQD